MNNNTDKTSQGTDSSKTNWMLEAMEADYQDTLRRELAEDEALWEPEDGTEFFERDRHLDEEQG